MDALSLSPEVADALRRGGPVVALESSVFSHGLPAPRNVETALAMEAAVREAGALPATVGIVDGVLRVGLRREEIERLAREGAAAKVSRRDIAVVTGLGGDGATTVSATATIAHIAGIGVMATGGIGGVHRGAEHSMDVSADLDTIARTPVVVVCSGAKSILDLAKTREVLESLGVPVLGFGSDRFPAFYCRDGGLPVDRRVDAPEEVAAVVAAGHAIGLTGGVIVAQPPPADLAITGEDMERWLAKALVESEAEGMGGAAATPFLLRRLAELSDGRTVDANVGLLLSNAALAARIAAAISG